VSFLRYILPIGAIGLAVLIAIAAVVLWQRTSRPASITALVVSIMAILLGIWLWNWFHYSPTRAQLEAWVTDPTSHVDLSTFMATPCPGAPFQLPSKGFVGFLYGDKSAPYMPWNPHTGVDIFGDGAPGNVPVYAAYEGGHHPHSERSVQPVAPNMDVLFSYGQRNGGYLLYQF
jgi:hypothetical protein